MSTSMTFGGALSWAGAWSLWVRAVLFGVLGLVVCGCAGRAGGTVAPGQTAGGSGAGTRAGQGDAGEVGSELDAAMASGDVLRIYEALEAELRRGEMAKGRRRAAHDAARIADPDSAAEAFALAALAGRVAEARGLAALDMVKAAEREARRSVALDPDYLGGAARRLLGTLYVMAGQHTEHGDPEAGLELLEGLVAQFPDDPVNHLRLAEGYLAQGDVEGALPSLCICSGARAELEPADRALLDRLIGEAGGVDALGCA